MTNPTPPLTAETDAIDVVNLITKKILQYLLATHSYTAYRL